MPIASIAAFLRLLDQYGLVDPEQRPKLLQLAESGWKDTRAFARELLQRGWLTPYQVNQLAQENGAALQLGAYVVLERLGTGGMGNVFKARHRGLGRIVALKVIHRDKLNNPAAVKRFEREIRVAGQLDHPNVVHAYDAEEVNGAKVLVMEYVEGTDLNKLVKENGPLPVREACDYIRQAALALQHAQDKGLVHRDVKPGNLMLQSGGTVKLLDLGLALLQQPLVEGSTSGPLTVAGKVVGTVDFIAPEQARDPSNVDIRADLYSLGCTFYFLLTGQPPFDGATVTNKLFKHALEEPRPVEQLRPGVPAPVTAVIRRLMAKRPDDRFQTPAEVAAVLEDVLRGRSPVARPAAADRTEAARPVRPAEPAAKAVAVPALPRKKRSDPRRLWIIGGGLAVLLVLLGVLALILPYYLGGPEGGSSKEEPRLSPAEREAQARLDDLRQQHQEGRSDEDKIRQEVAAFRWRYPGLPQTLQAMAFLRELPSPLDELDPAKIPERLRPKDAPAELVAVLDGPAGAVAVAPDGARVLTAHGGTVACRDLVKGTAGTPFEKVRGPMTMIALSPDGKRAMLGGRGKNLGLWDVLWQAATGREVRKLDAHTSEVTALALSPDGRWGLSGGSDGRVYLWNLSDGSHFVLDGHKASVRGVAFTPDGKLGLTTGEDQTLRVWDLEIRRERKPVVEAPGPVTCLAVAPDGKRAYTGGPTGVLRWTLGPPATDGSLDGYAGPVAALALTADGRYLAATDGKGWVGVWNLDSGRKVIEWRLPATEGLAWALDGRHLIVGGGPVFVLRLPEGT
jgi:serine/threonine protein kinase/WD40 repeat protein